MSKACFISQIWVKNGKLFCFTEHCHKNNLNHNYYILWWKIREHWQSFIKQMIIKFKSKICFIINNDLFLVLDRLYAATFKTTLSFEFKKAFDNKSSLFLKFSFLLWVKSFYTMEIKIPIIRIFEKQVVIVLLCYLSYLLKQHLWYNEPILWFLVWLHSNIYC